MKKYLFLVVFIFASIAQAIAAIASWIQLEVFSKPLIMLALIGYYLSGVRVRSTPFVLALFFSCLGDSLLLVQRESFFMFGLGSFLAAHGFYIFSYRQHEYAKSGVDEVAAQKVRLAFPVMLAGTGLVVVLLPTLGDLKIPVIIYATILTGMVVSAIFRLGRTDRTSFWMVVCGAVLFMTSDSLLALDKFRHPIANASLWIMITYCVAQFLIVEGILRHPAKAQYS